MLLHEMSFLFHQRFTFFDLMPSIVKDRQGVSAHVWVRLEIFNNRNVSFSSIHLCNIT